MSSAPPAASVSSAPSLSSALAAPSASLTCLAGLALLALLSLPAAAAAAGTGADAVAGLAVLPQEQEAPADTIEDEEEDEDEDEDGVEPYDEVITEEAISDEGLFTAHRVGEKLYYEIPRSELGSEYLWVARLAQVQTGLGYGGQKVRTRVVRWSERPDDRVLLREASHEVVADTSRPIYEAVRNATFEPVIRAFDVEAYGPDSSLVVEVTDLFTTDVSEFSPRERLGVSSLDRDRSFLEKVLAFPDNIEVEALLTYSGRRANDDDGGRFGRSGPSPSTVSVVMHHSMIRLPEEPMMPRLADDRVGYFEVAKYDYGRDEHRAPERRYITRWRLEKRDPRAEISEPVEPIVFYIDRGTPEKWRPWLKKGVESWQSAFEEAGFRNAIVARDAPTVEEDPDWHPEDARYSVIRWLPSTVQNASGPHVHDPRTGEILESDIQWYHNVMNLLRGWYFVQVGPLDDRVRQLPMPDSLMGRLVQYVAAHEVGHTLGFYHNMKASSSYPVDSLRSASFTERYGNEASIMDYGRFNYVAQPGDGARLVPIVGPYDEYAVMWGYRPIPEAATPDEERETLARWARMQDEDPMLRFGHLDRVDPGAQREDLGADPVEATRYGLRNIRRVVPMLIPATSRSGESWDDLEELYGRLVGQWARELGHVVSVVGGVRRQTKYAGQEGVVHTPVPREEQREAVAFLLANAFRTPDYLLEPEILRRIEATGTVDRVRDRQARILGDLLSDSRLRRLVEQSAVRAGEVEPYPAAELFADVREGIWAELEEDDVRIDPYRRNLQRSWLETMAGKLQGNSEIRPLARGELIDLAERIDDRIGEAEGRETRLHLRDIAYQIERALDPR